MERSNTTSTIGLTQAMDVSERLPLSDHRSNDSFTLSYASVADSMRDFSRPLNSRRTKPIPPTVSNSQTTRIKSSNKKNSLSDATGSGTKWVDTSFLKKRSQYFEKEFASREPNNTARDRIIRDSLITIDIKINRCLNRNEQHFHVDLSFTLAEMYQKPQPCIMIVVNTEVTILLKGTSDPAYHLVISALPSEIAVTKNKRCTHLIQQYLNETLNIPASRGVIKFEAVAEENHATNGFTARQEVERLEREAQDGAIIDSVNRQQDHKAERSNTLSVNHPGQSSTSLVQSFTPSFLRQCQVEDQQIESHSQYVKEEKRVKQKKSILSFFGL